MELVTEELNGAAILNLENACSNQDLECRECNDIGGAVHNWIMITGLGYVIIDLQDEKDICPTFIVELLQLRKRHHIPFLFTGVMERPRKQLEAYDFTADGTPVFVSPEDALVYLKKNHPIALSSDLSLIQFGAPVMNLKARQIARAEVSDDSAEAEI